MAILRFNYRYPTLNSIDLILPITYDILKVKSLPILLIVIFLGTLSGCASTRLNKTQTAFEAFKREAVNAKPILITPPALYFTGAQALAAWLEQIDSATADDVIEIAQFYVRPGRMLGTIRSHLAAKLRQGTHLKLKLDFMFSVSALKEFEPLKSFPRFELEIANPPSAEFIAFVQATYGIRDAAGLIDALISADLPRLQHALAGSKLETALDPPSTSTPTPEVLLGRVLQRVVAETGFFKLLKLKSQLEILASRFHDKYLLVHRKREGRTNVVLGGRGWADSFAETDRQANSLYYTDLDLAFEVPDTSSSASGGIPAVLSLANGTSVTSARSFETNMLAVIRSARHEIKIFTPYFTPTDRILHALSECTLNGIQVSVYTNSYQTSDIPLVPIYMYESLNLWSQALGPAFHFFTFVAPPGQCLHTKATLVDSEMAVVGSGNWDYRSFLYDSDSFVAIQSKDVAQSLAAGLLDSKYARWQEWTPEELSTASTQLRRLVPEKNLNAALKFLTQDTVRKQL